MMRKLFILFVTAVAVISCTKFDEIWDKLNDHELRIKELESLCAQMNTNISSLQTIVKALQDNDYVTGVSAIMENGKEVGYTLTFSKGGPVTIYHGKDGKNGLDGYTPLVGVEKDADGVYYWTLDGVWILDENGQKIKAVGTDGKDGADGTPGQDGADGAPGQDGVDGEDGANGADGAPGQDGAPGEDGADGKDGVTPLLKIESGKWFVSYDNGISWIELGQATGNQGPQGDTGSIGPQGPSGENGADGDAFFKSVTETNDYVLLVLSNGSEIKIPKYSAIAANLTLCKVTGYTATFNGTVVRHSLDLKVSVYYSTVNTLTVYKNKGKVSVTEFDGEVYTLRLTELSANTTYYYFIEVICDGNTTYSEIRSFRTNSPDSYVDWGDGENVGGDI